MAVTFTDLDSIGVDTGDNTAGQTTLATSSWTPVANKLYLFCIAAYHGAGGLATDPTLSGNGLTWTLLKRLTVTSFGTNNYMCVFGALSGGSPSAGQTTFTRGGSDNWNGITIQVIKVDGADVSGSLSNCFVSQSGATNVSAAQDASSTVISVNYAQATTSGNGLLAFSSMMDGMQVGAPRTNWTELIDFGQNGLLGANVQARTSGTDTAASVTFDNSNGCGIIAFEVKASGGGGGGGGAGGGAFYMHHYRNLVLE